APESSEAFGRPGLAPRWTSSSKEGLGTAYSTASRLWFTLSHGILNEVYFPTVDSPQIRDLQYLITDGETFFHEEKRDLETRLEYINEHSLGYRLTGEDPRRRYRIVKEVISDPHLACVLIRTRLEGDEAFLKKLRLYVLLAPHLESRGWENSAAKAVVAGRDLLVVSRDQVQLALGASIPFARTSCGFVGASDGWTDLRDNFRMDWEFESASEGNVAVMGELDLSVSREFTLGLAFGFGRHGATSVLLQSLGLPFTLKYQQTVKNLPLTLKLGSVFHASERWLTSLDIAAPRDNAPYFAVGTEYLMPVAGSWSFAGRLGYNSQTLGDITGVSGLSIGIGIGSNPLSFDYAFVPLGGLGVSVRAKTTSHFQFGLMA
ncbi:MAG: hypothetical protein B7X11_04850, partial [Acidobacteria bacterium 37-65-4]